MRWNRCAGQTQFILIEFVISADCHQHNASWKNPLFKSNYESYQLKLQRKIWHFQSSPLQTLYFQWKTVDPELFGYTQVRKLEKSIKVAWIWSITALALPNCRCLKVLKGISVSLTDFFMKLTIFECTSWKLKWAANLAPQRSGGAGKCPSNSTSPWNEFQAEWQVCLPRLSLSEPNPRPRRKALKNIYEFALLHFEEPKKKGMKKNLQMSLLIFSRAPPKKAKLGAKWHIWIMAH